MNNLNSFLQFKEQFLLTKKNNFDLKWPNKEILNYHLFYHPELQCCQVSNSQYEMVMLGSIYDYENPEYNNKQILNDLIKYSSFDLLIDGLSKYAGHYVFIVKTNDDIILFNDACAQKEIYYDTSFTVFGSQSKLISRVIDLSPYESYSEPSRFYNSSMFFSKKLFIGDTTHVANIKHLSPNFYIDVKRQQIIRYFPRIPQKPIPIDEASKEVIKMLKGIIKSASFRSKVFMPVTGGYDSRLLFLSSIDIDCKYYVAKLPNMEFDHNDILIPIRLAGIFNKGFKIVVEKTISDLESQILEESIDFPRLLVKPDDEFSDHLLLNGNISEIARNYYGYHNNISPEVLTALSGYKDDKFVITEYNKWLESSSNIILDMGYHVLDIFYWEEKMRNWAAKSKTESSAIGSKVFSPFCSHRLLEILLSTPRNCRGVNKSKLYDHIFCSLSQKAASVPINPSPKNSLIRFLKFLRLFIPIQRLRLKVRMLNNNIWG